MPERLPLLVLTALALAGCDRLFEKRPKEKIAAAEAKAKAGEHRNAVALYEDAIDGTSASAEVHYRLAVIYDEKLKNPVSAMHHFSRYLELAPTGTFAKEARAYKKEGDLKILGNLSGGAPMTQQDAVRLKNDNLRLRQELGQMRQEKALERAAALKAAKGVKGEKPERVKAPPAPGSKQHTVQSGETLASISQKYYKTRNKAQDILDANHNALGGKTTIKPGQTLIIP